MIEAKSRVSFLAPWFPSSGHCVGVFAVWSFWLGSWLHLPRSDRDREKERDWRCCGLAQRLDRSRKWRRRLIDSNFDWHMAISLGRCGVFRDNFITDKLSLHVEPPDYDGACVCLHHPLLFLSIPLSLSLLAFALLLSLLFRSLSF